MIKESKFQSHFIVNIYDMTVIISTNPVVTTGIVSLLIICS